MYLKKIEVQGFKSFANKIVFEFHNGITGIVGPNGSGKSNVSDAVRWVLGEQSAKQLRGGNMQDVIFAGTELRKPQGFAYVAITIDNKEHKLPIDFDEIVVSRRLYRSGESEYMINGSICRLRDIQEVFYDTGIGKDGYSIIGQGQVERILSGKPDERRELFDEAAGITKYKRRKLLTQKKLESEEASLVRVSDILAELEKQVGPLKKQSDTAKEYLRLKDNLKVYDVNAFLLDNAQLSEQIEGLQKKEDIVSEDLKISGEQAQNIISEYDELETKIRQAQERLNELNYNISDKNSRASEISGNINVIKEQINSEYINIDHIKLRNKNIDNELILKKEQIEKYNKEKESLLNSYSEDIKRQEDLEKNIEDKEKEIKSLEVLINKFKSDIMDKISEKTKLSVDKQGRETLLEQLRIRKSEIAQRLLKLKSEISVIDIDLSSKASDIEEINTNIAELDKKYGEINTEIEENERIYSKLLKSLNDIQAVYQSSLARLETLKNIAERYDGYGNSIKKVMETRDRIKGIHGVVADLIAVDKEYETAIETALGGRIQNIVTDSEATAKNLIEYLKKNKYGRATFLPLSSKRKISSFGKETVLKETGVLGPASELVACDERYKELIISMLGQIIVVDNIDNAIKIENKYNYAYRIVTKEGELLSPGGALSGGAFKNSGNLLGRRREIEELEAELKGIVSKTEDIQNKLDESLNALREKKNSLENIKAIKQEYSLNKNTLMIEANALNNKKAELDNSTIDFSNEHDELNLQISTLLDESASIRTSIESLDSSNSSIEDSIAKRTEELKELQGFLIEEREELSSVKVSNANINQNIIFADENIQRLNEESSKLDIEKLFLAEDIEKSELNIKDKNKGIDEAKAELENLNKELSDLNKEYESLYSDNDKASKSLRRLFDKKNDISSRVSDLEKELIRLCAQRERAEEMLAAASSYMWNEYELTYNTALTLKDEKLSDLKEIKAFISNIKNEIKGLGYININAIDDYKEVSQRYELIRTQYDDIVAAKEELTDIIDNLDAGMRKQFMEKFKYINEEFDKVFKELFGGGSGRLVLEEGVDILESGISIISQPPGKKLQNMMQLSGGEKALTAISLLFAIQNLKPSPFALLDEIEAALDDSNVDRFARYLHKLKDNTQFIVITHRRGTMVSADRLYGITMQEKGVSTLVSVNLIEDKLDN